MQIYNVPKDSTVQKMVSWKTHRGQDRIDSKIIQIEVGNSGNCWISDRHIKFTIDREVVTGILRIKTQTSS